MEWGYIDKARGCTCLMLVAGVSDVLSKAQRSFCMSRIRGRDTKPEIILRKALWGHGYRYRIKNKLPGKPDIVFVKNRIAIFVDGCFWHCCPEHYVPPKTRSAFWRKKISGNVERDKKNNALLDESGWKVLRIWEHEVMTDVDSCVARVVEAIRSK